MVNWIYDEVVLAAELVRDNGWVGVRAQSKQAQSLSLLLRRGQLHFGEKLPANFRSPSSIQHKTYDLATADEGYMGEPKRGSKLDKEIIRAFRANPGEMRARAAAIYAILATGESFDSKAFELNEGSAREGGILEFVATRFERSAGLRSRKIADVKAAGGSIECEVCGFNFGRSYGIRGEGYIEVHHRLPLHVSGRTRNRPQDLALLCANCHRMCHRGEWVTPSEVVLMVRNQLADMD